MKAFVIAINNHEYSQKSADNCISSANHFGLHVEKFSAITPNEVDNWLTTEGLQWTWANNNTSASICPFTQLEHFPYKAKNLKTKIACSLSHYALWKKCCVLNEPILILEHDAIFVRALPEIQFKGAVQINDPIKGGYRGKYHSEQMKLRGTHGTHPLTRKRSANSNIPDGFSGNSAYIINPWAAQEFINAFKMYGIWPNDATICLQLFPWLEEFYPFITKVNQSYSTSST